MPKRRQISINDKYTAILEVEKGQKKIIVAQKYDIPHNTLSTWMKNAESIKAAYESGSTASKVKRMRKAAYDDVEEATLLWFEQARARNISISGPILRSKAVSFANDLGHNDFSCSDGWLSRFKARHGIIFKTISGEAKSVDVSVIDPWKTTILPTSASERLSS